MRNEKIAEKIALAVKILDEIDEMIESQPTELQKIDYEISDWLHYIEANEMDEKTSKKVINKLRELRQQRKCLHKEYEIENAYKNNSSKMMGNNTRQLLMAEINKAIKKYDNEYKNRILTEEEIQKTIGQPKRKGRPKKEGNNE